MTNEVSVDDAVAALVAEAEKHEKEHGAEFCDDNRVSLVVFVMLHLDLTLDHLGAIAEGFITMSEAELDDNQTDEWPDRIGDCDGKE